MGASEVRRDERDFRAGGRRFCVSSFSGSFFSRPALLKSKAVPGVFGVLLALPKLAKAPLPSPKADDAPEPVGEATAVAEDAGAALNGLDLVERLPNRLPELVSPASRLSLRSVLFMERLSLLLLLLMYSISRCHLLL